MCGVCGRDLTPDAAFPTGRTTRQQMVAAQMLTGLCQLVSANVKVIGRAEGFIVVAAGRPLTLCATARDVWLTIHAVTPQASDALYEIPGALTARYSGEAERGLLRALMSEGRVALLWDVPSRAE